MTAEKWVIEGPFANDEWQVLAPNRIVALVYQRDDAERIASMGGHFTDIQVHAAVEAVAGDVVGMTPSPTDDEHDALTDLLMGWSSTHPDRADLIADAILAAGFRLPADSDSHPLDWLHDGTHATARAIANAKIRERIETVTCTVCEGVEREHEISAHRFTPETTESGLRDAIEHIEGSVDFQDAINPEDLRVVIEAARRGPVTDAEVDAAGGVLGMDDGLEHWIDRERARAVLEAARDALFT